jgi:multidrug efflux pump
MYLTLLGIVLAIGIVVDDAIVVLENIYTKIENKMAPKEAAAKGAAEIFFAVISTTVALVSVFLPVIFLQGLTGRLFREFGIVIAGSVINLFFCGSYINTNAQLTDSKEKRNS